MVEEQGKREASGATKDTWRELGEQFEQLGRSLATAIRNTLETEENRRRLESLRQSVEGMAAEVSQAIEEASESPEGKKVRADVERTAESAIAAGQKAFDEARPHVVSALRQVSDELDKFSRHMEERRGETPPRTNEPGPGMKA